MFNLHLENITVMDNMHAQPYFRKVYGVSIFIILRAYIISNLPHHVPGEPRGKLSNDALHCDTCVHKAGLQEEQIIGQRGSESAGVQGIHVQGRARLANQILNKDVLSPYLDPNPEGSGLTKCFLSSQLTSALPTPEKS